MFSREVDLIGPLGRHVIGQKVHTCQWGPPTPVLVPVAGPANQGALTLTPVFCPVNNQISCGQHRFKNEQPQIGNLDS